MEAQGITLLGRGLTDRKQWNAYLTSPHCLRSYSKMASSLFVSLWVTCHL